MARVARCGALVGVSATRPCAAFAGLRPLDPSADFAIEVFPDDAQLSDYSGTDDDDDGAGGRGAGNEGQAGVTRDTDALLGEVRA